MKGSTEIVSSFTTPKARYQWERHFCGKESCTRCPHGPYLVAYYKDPTGEVGPLGKPKFKIVRKYIGRRLSLLPGDSGEILKIKGDLII